MQLKQIMMQAVALVLALSLFLSLSACSPTDAINAVVSMTGVSVEIVPGERLYNSLWINSDLEGSIDENTELNLKDDFHTAVNRDWFLETKSEGDEYISSFTDAEDALWENKIRLLIPGTEADPDPKVMSKETLEHLQDLIWDMIDLAGNQEKRNELGLEPLRPYLNAIEQIDSMDALTEYLKNIDGMNIIGENFFDFDVDRPENTRDFYTVHITYPGHILLEDFYAYTILGTDAYFTLQSKKAALEYVLENLGYSHKEIRKLIKNCYTFESKMAFLAPHKTEVQNSSYSSRGHKIYTLEDIRRIQGDFPLTELLEDAGIAHSETFRVYEPGLLNYMGSYYEERNLDKFKAYFTIHTVLDALPYLDDTCQELNREIMNTTAGIDSSTLSADETETLDPEVMEETKVLEIYDDYIVPLLYKPYQLVYIGTYCTSAAKQELLNLLENIRTYYIDLLGTTEWLSKETRELAIEKMEKMEFRVLYPDVLPDYSGLIYGDYEEGGNLLDAVAAIRKVNNTPNTDKVNQPVKRTDWDLSQMDTTDSNAANQHNLNSIVILAGIMAGDFMYDEDAPIEQNYGRLGVILGHEVSHAFDTSGYIWNSEGLFYGWWTNEDEIALRLRSDKLANYYTALSVFPGSTSPYKGQLVQGEAISDMGGVKCMLALAEEIPDFDYDLFFRSFASTWRVQTSLVMEMERANDEHPLGFLRTNVTLQQFDKFFETYDIGPGDGMYLAPKDRVLVW